MKSRNEFTTNEEYNEYLRINFAGLAMQGMLANSSLNNLKEETVAEISVLCADKLLENLENTK